MEGRYIIKTSTMLASIFRMLSRELKQPQLSQDADETHCVLLSYVQAKRMRVRALITGERRMTAVDATVSHMLVSYLLKRLFTKRQQRKLISKVFIFF